jgi:hypothetical protein
MSIATKTIAGAALALALGVSGALAQQAGGPPAGGPMMGRDGGPMMGRDGGGWGKMDPAEMQKRMAEHHAKHMQKLHDLLGITSNQEGAFKTFADSMTPPKMGDWAERRKEIDSMTTPQRLDERLARATERYNAEKSRIDATKRFYAQLTPTQKKSFDAASDMMRDHHDGRGRGMMGGRGGPGMMGGPGGGPGMMGGPDGPPSPKN